MRSLRRLVSDWLLRWAKLTAPWPEPVRLSDSSHSTPMPVTELHVLRGAATGGNVGEGYMVDALDPEHGQAWTDYPETT